MTKQIKTFEIREDEEYPKVYIDGELYDKCGLIRSIEMNPIGAYLITIKTKTEPVMIHNNCVVENIDQFCIFKSDDSIKEILDIFRCELCHHEGTEEIECPKCKWKIGGNYMKLVEE